MRLRVIFLFLLACAASAAAQAAGSTGTAGEGASAARITGLAAAAAEDGSAIEVTFVSSDPRRDLLLFWGTAPMTAAEDLLRSTAKAQLDAGTVRYAVPAVPGTDYWFAVLDAGLFKVGGVPLVPGENTTISGVRVPAAAASGADGAVARRAQPLPSLQLDVTVDTGREMAAGGVPDIPAEREVSPATAQAIAVLLQEAGAEPRPILKVQLLSEAAAGDPVLQGVAAQTLAGGDWAGAEWELKDYLSIPRAPALRAAARFYLGQAYWFQGRHRDAFFEFLGCEDAFPRESRAWQDACLTELAAGR